MRAETILDIIKRIKTEERDFKTAVEKHLLGATVLTKYNNKTYRIDEITYDVKPSDTFKQKEKEISYIDYYKVIATQSRVWFHSLHHQSLFSDSLPFGNS